MPPQARRLIPGLLSGQVAPALIEHAGAEPPAGTRRKQAFKIREGIGTQFPGLEVQCLPLKFKQVEIRILCVRLLGGNSPFIHQKQQMEYMVLS